MRTFTLIGSTEGNVSDDETTVVYKGFDKRFRSMDESELTDIYIVSIEGEIEIFAIDDASAILEVHKYLDNVQESYVSLGHFKKEK